MINGMPDHVHALFLLNGQMTASDVIKYAKGGSSHSINQLELISEKFAWQTGFAAYSVSESQIEKVVNYIKMQKFHHQNKTYLEELEELARLHKVDEVIEFISVD
jgi:REP-associated tyrosine transposase